MKGMRICCKGQNRFCW